jgi:hypothetical protein
MFVKKISLVEKFSRKKTGLALANPVWSTVTKCLFGPAF